MGGPVDVEVGNRPFGVVLSPDGATAYVGSQDGAVIVVDIAARQVVTSITVPGGDGGFSMAVSPDGKSLYVSGFAVEGGVRVIDTTSNSVTAVRFDGRPIAGGPIAVSPDGKRGYVDDDGMGGFRLLDLDTHFARDEWLIRDSGAPVAVAITADGRFLYAVNPGCTAAIIDTQKAPVTPTSPDIGLPSASARIGEIVIGCDPTDVKALPAGDRVVVVDADGSAFDESTLSWIDTAARKLVGREVPLGLAPGEVATGVAIAPNGDEAYVLHRKRQDGTGGALTVVAVSQLKPHEN
jgi:DNA-binding beta-propeller fold protein YncE